MKNPEGDLTQEVELTQEQELNFAEKFIKNIKLRLLIDPDFQQACSKTFLSSPRSLSWQGEYLNMLGGDVVFERSNGEIYRVCVESGTTEEGIRVTRYSGSQKEGNYTDESVSAYIFYGSLFGPEKRGKPERGVVQYARYHPRREPPDNTNDLIAIREAGRFLRENFPVSS